MIEIIPNWHPVWVHFPIALLSMATVFFLLGLILSGRAGENVTSAARWNLVLGCFLLLPTLVTGYLAYNSVAHDGPGHQAMERHMTAAWVTVAVFALAAVLAWLDRRRTRGASVLLAAVMLVGTAAVGVTGYLGAENVYRHGLGVERLPKGVQDTGAERSPAIPEAGEAEESSDPEPQDAQQGSGQGGTETEESVPEGHEGHDHAH
ncbi:hypothetical protein CK501_15105 [Halovibrio salipaludis]|uniref:DUF2231 domain-containing protein n=1 Tax=Halovibrio salipaludis TaxID=2032626 RepID=A0A2A2EV88_9GAMM|nr:DUF2231 domain-containing protein [Halovibrio salipaludis]PAU77046.1 hypothetical protein CK501_15105 [Halovibrio salipaludis]